MFRTQVAADITLGIYGRYPVLIRDDDLRRQPLGLSFGTLFHMANDSGLFHQPEDFAHDECNGWSFEHDRKEYLPLYEGKMLAHFDEGFATYRDATQAQLNVRALQRLSEKEHDDPNLEPLARYWVRRSNVLKRLGDNWDREWLLGWRDITKAEQMRTLIPSVLPATAVGYVFLIAVPRRPKDAPSLHAV
jgi:hypothetical protein